MPEGENFVYLHGFASSPRSAKANYLRDRFAELEINLKVPDLNQGGFSELTITRQIHQVEAELPSIPVTLIGSSLGGLVAAWLAQRQLQVQCLVLLAPAFEFLSHWLPRIPKEQLERWQKDQFLMVYHYGEQQTIPLNYKFILDAARYKDTELLRPIPTLILHGKYDEVIPIQASRNFAALHHQVQLISLDSDHALGNVLPQIWQEIKIFCELESK